MNEFVFVVDTSSIAVKFYREMGSYICGISGDHGTTQFARMNNLSVVGRKWINEHIIWKTDFYGFRSPFDTFINPDYFMDDFGNVYERKSYNEQESVNRYNRLLLDYCHRNIEKECRNMWMRDHPMIAHIERRPAHTSVGIFFTDEPPNHLLSEFKWLAVRFSSIPNQSNLIIPGVDLKNLYCSVKSYRMLSYSPTRSLAVVI